jgi:hypothetical protein
MQYKKFITLALSALLLLGSSKTWAQSVGLTLGVGSYAAKQENSSGNAIPTEGSLYKTVGLHTEFSLGKGLIPLTFSVDQFEARMDANAVQSVTAKANTVKVGTGYTLLFADNQSKKQPFLGVGIDAEVYNNATFRYTDEQQGNLLWHNNAYANALAGVRFSKGDVRFDVFAKYAVGLANRIDNGTYTDQTFTIGTRMLINP